MNRLLAFATVLTLLTTTACGTPVPAKPESSVPVTSSSAAPVATPITDETVLRELWDVYIEKSPPLLNEGVEDLSTLTAARATTAAITVWSRSNDIASLPTVELPRELYKSNQTEIVRYWTLAEAAAQVERTFDMKIADPKAYFEGMEHSNRSGPYYLPEQQAVAFMEDGPWVQDKPYGEPTWDYRMEKATDNGDGTVSVTLARNDERVNKPDTGVAFVLRKLDGGGYCYKTAHAKYYNNNVANPTGNYRTVDIAEAATGQGLSGMELLWQDGDSVILGNTGGRATQNKDVEVIQLVRMNTKTAKVEHPVNIETPSLRGEANLLKLHGTADGIVVSSRYGVQVYDLQTLELVRETPLPASLTAKMIPRVQATTPEGRSIDKEFFEEFAITADGSRYWYSNHEGLFTVDTATGSEKLLVPSTVSRDSPISGIISTPRALTPVDGESKLAYLLYGYEGTQEMGVVDLEGNKTISQATTSACFGSNGAAAVTQDGNSTTITYADYRTGVVKTQTITPPDLATAAPMANPLLPAQSSSGYIMTGMQLLADEEGKLTTVLLRAGLSDMAFERPDFDIEVDCYLVGITDEGTAIVSYFYSRGEYGLLLVD